MSPPSRDEIIQRLKKCSVGGTAPEKAATISAKVLPHRENIIRFLHSFSSTNSAEFDKLLPKAGLPKRATAFVIVEMLYGIHTSLHLLSGFINSGESSGRATRADRAFFEDVLVPLNEIFQTPVTVAVADLNEEKMDNSRKSMVKLSDVERKRKFLALGAKEPEDPAMMYCPICDCKGTVDVPPEIVQKMRRNCVKLDAFRAEKQEWERKKQNGEECSRVGTRGKTTSRAPRFPTMERIPIVCHCHQMVNPNPRKWDSKGSTCIIKCTNTETGEHYGYDPVTRKTNCPSCLCNCTAAFEVSID